MQDSKRDTDVLNSLLDSMGEARVGWYGRMALKHVKYHMWNKWPGKKKVERGKEESVFT